VGKDEGGEERGPKRERSGPANGPDYPQHSSSQLPVQQQVVSSSTLKHIQGLHAAAGLAAESRALPARTAASTNKRDFFFMVISL
jgi:hypothetical protein